VEKSAAAIAAAEELAQEDCLVVTHLQLTHASALFSYANMLVDVDYQEAATEIKQAQVQGLEVLLAVIATLERRKEAGTLLAGACRRWPEEEWYTHVLEQRQSLNKDLEEHDKCPPEEQVVLARFVGYDAYMDAGMAAVIALRSQWSVVCSSKFGQFAVRAIDLMSEQPPRAFVGQVLSLPSEHVLSGTMQEFCDDFQKMELGSPPHPSVMEVFNRWQHFAHSGMLQARGLDTSGVRFLTVSLASEAANQARLAAATLRCCSLRSCAARELHPGHHKICSACRGAAYCCREHQVEDWPQHKAACKAARKAAAASGAAAGT
jgi:hypothetical protein